MFWFIGHKHLIITLFDKRKVGVKRHGDQLEIRNIILEMIKGRKIGLKTCRSVRECGMSLYGIQFSVNNYMRTTVLSALLVRARRQQDMFIVIACIRSTQLHFYRYKYFRYKGLQGIGLDLTSEWYGLEGELALYTVFFFPL